MSWLSPFDAKPKPQSDEQKATTAKSQHKRYLIETEAARLVDAIPHDLATIRAEHERDVDSYQLKAHRFADFLTIVMERWIGYEPSFDRHSISINLSMTKHIETAVGHEPKCDGKAYLYIFDWMFDRDPETPVCANSPLKDMRSKTFTSPYDYHVGYEDNYVDQILTDMPVPARDDAIYFVGTDVTLAIPHGRLDDCLATIQKAISDGYEPPSEMRVEE